MLLFVVSSNTLCCSLFFRMVVGIVEQLASYHFDLEVKMNQIGLQGENGATFTSWRITAVDESQRWKLSPLASSDAIREPEPPVCFDGVELPSKCPFSGKTLKQSNQVDDGTDEIPEKCPFHKQLGDPQESSTCSSETEELTSAGTNSRTSDIDFSGDHLKELFPFHIMVDQDFSILQLGAKLPKLLDKTWDEVRGRHIGEIVQITR